MKCNQAQENISQNYDGQLKKEEWRKLKGHLAGCSDCLQVFQQMAKLSDKVKKLNVPYKPVTIPNTILRGKPFQFKLATGISIAFALIALVIGVGTLKYSPVVSKYPAKLTKDSGSYDASRWMNETNIYSKDSSTTDLKKKDYGIDTTKKSSPSKKQLQIVQDVALTIKIKNMLSSFKKVTDIVEAGGGYIAGSNLANVEAQKQGGTSKIVAKVPADKLTTIKAEIRSLGIVLSEKVNTKDVSQALVDLQANLRNYQRQENRYLQLIDRAYSIKDLERLESKLAQIRQSIEQTQGEIKYQQNRVAMATLTVNLTKKAPVESTPNWLIQTLVNSWKNFANVSKALISLIFWLMPFVLVGLVGYGVYRLIAKPF